MEGICTRCARLSLRTGRAYGRGQTVLSARSFSASTVVQDDRPTNSPVPKLPATPDAVSAPTGPARRPLIRRFPVDGNPRAPPQAGQVLRRNNTQPGQSGQPGQRGQLPQRTGSTPRQGALLRRTGGPPRPGQPGQRPGGPPRSGAPGRTGPGAPNQPRRSRRPSDRPRFTEGEDDGMTEAEADEHISKYIDPPANPTEAIAYNPVAQTMAELQKDWPNTPLSDTGLTASVVQKIEWLARRLPHGYQTPEQIAEHFHKGNLTRFESEEEKKAVLAIAQELAKKRADLLTERKGEVVQVEDMGLNDLSKSGGAKTLFDTVVRGVAPPTQKQNMPFLESIVRNLDNNGTYGSPATQQFMTKIQSMMPTQGGRKAAPRDKTS